MSDAQAHSAQTGMRRAGSRPGANHPLPLWPMAHLHAEPVEGSETAAEETETVGGDDAVVQLARELRTAAHAHRAYLAELGQGDVEPVEDWSTWYAEYLLGLR
jgi:hypothetical protein